MVNIASSTMIQNALARIHPYIKHTPLIQISALNKELGHEIYFKLECLQNTGSFKVRGLLNGLLNLKDRGIMPDKIVTYGTGNHGVALAWAGSTIFNIKVEVFLPKYSSDLKKTLIKHYNGQVIVTNTRAEAESMALYAGNQPGCLLLPPSDNDDVIVGAGTVALEVFSELKDVQAIFVPIGGGSLASGTLLAKELLSPHTKVYAGEPEKANDAAISYRTNQIFRFKDTPQTIADGVRTLGLTEKIFEHIKKLNGIYEISELEIGDWTKKFTESAQIKCEPTSALALAAAHRFLQNKQTSQRIVVIITGGNVL